MSRRPVTHPVMHRLSAALWAVASLATACAAAGEPVVGTPFLQARAGLLRGGWAPLVTRAADDDTLIGIEHDLMAAGMVELDGCAIDRPLCTFNYRQGRQCLRLVTAGEAMPALTVHRITHDCPSP